MKYAVRVTVVACFALGVLGCWPATPVAEDTSAGSFLGTGSYTGPYWPTDGWRACWPEEVGMDSEKLQLVYEYAANPSIRTHGVIIIKDGYIVGEAYFGGWSRSLRHESYSVAKSFTSALIGIALDRGLIGSVNDEVSQYYSQWQRPGTPAAKQRITIRHLLTMTAGLEWQENDYYGENSEDDIPRLYREGVVDFIEYVLEKPVAAEPGTRWYYSSGESLLLSGIIEAAAGRTVLGFAEEHLFAPLGISSFAWEHDPAGHTITAWGLGLTVRDYAKFGYLFLREGEWEGQRVVSADWVRESTDAISDTLDHYGYLWWLPHAYSSYRDAGVTEQSFMAMGIYVQRIIVIPEDGIVAVRVGNDVPSNDLEWETSEFIRLILDALDH